MGFYSHQVSEKEVFVRWALSIMAAGLLALGVVGCSDSSSGSGSSSAPGVSKKYKCSMDSGERDTPGPCPKCGMALK